MSSKLIDLSYEVEHGMITYKGLPAPLICDFLSGQNPANTVSQGPGSTTGTLWIIPFTALRMGSIFQSFHQTASDERAKHVCERAFAANPAQYME